ncbi:MAG: DMT family transporter [Bacteroidetes bacterium]|nr:DMT family transporter [Bacteroidota bacterium]
MPLNTQQIKVHGTLLFVGLIYGATYSIAKIAMPDLIKPFGFILVRVILATLIFWLFDVVKGGEVIRYRRDYIRLMVCALFGIAINQLIFFKGLSMTSTISASIIMTSNPIIVLVASWLILKEPVTKLKVAGIILGSTGAVMLILRNEVQWEAGSFLGDLFILINAASYGIYLVLVKPLMARYRAITIVKWVFLFGLIIIIPFGTGELLAVNWYDMPMEGWASILYIILFTTVLAYLLNVWALQFITPTIVSYYIYLQPLFATLIAFVFLNESPGANVIIYTLMIFSGVYLVSKKRF